MKQKTFLDYIKLKISSLEIFIIHDVYHMKSYESYDASVIQPEFFLKHCLVSCDSHLNNKKDLDQTRQLFLMANY